MLNSEEIKPVALAIIELHLTEGISQSVGRSVGRSVGQSVSQPVIQKKILLNRKFSNPYQLSERVYGWSEDNFGVGYA